MKCLRKTKTNCKCEQSICVCVTACETHHKQSMKMFDEMNTEKVFGVVAAFFFEK